jgi:hypothetical protein
MAGPLLKLKQYGVIALVVTGLTGLGYNLQRVDALEKQVVGISKQINQLSNAQNTANNQQAAAGGINKSDIEWIRESLKRIEGDLRAHIAASRR